MNVYLIGYRCTGKTTLAQHLARSLGWQWIDADVKLTNDHGRSVAEIVAKEGWPGFREKEKRVLREISEMNHHVIATGGGVILDPDNVRIMKETGVVVWLQADPDTILSRMVQDQMTDDQRPALTDKRLQQEIIDTLEERLPLYDNAMHFAVDTANREVVEIQRIIAETLGQQYTIIGSSAPA